MAASIELGIGARALAVIKRVLAFGQRVATLEARIAALESRLKKQPPDICDYCGERSMRKIRSWPLRGESQNKWRKDDWTCEKCGETEQRVVYFKDQS